MIRLRVGFGDAGLVVELELGNRELLGSRVGLIRTRLGSGVRPEVSGEPFDGILFVWIPNFSLFDNFG